MNPPSDSTFFIGNSSTIKAPNDYFDHRCAIIVTTHRVEGSEDVLTRSDVHQSRQDRARIQHGTVRVALFSKVMVGPEQLPTARAHGPIHEAADVRTQHLSSSKMLTALSSPPSAGSQRRPSIADLFVAVIGKPKERNPGRNKMSPVNSNAEMPNEYRVCWTCRVFTDPALLTGRSGAEIVGNHSSISRRSVSWPSCFCGFMISAVGLAERWREVLTWDTAKARAAIEIPYDVAAMMIIFTAFIVGVFYCLDALCMNDATAAFFGNHCRCLISPRSFRKQRFRSRFYRSSPSSSL